MITIRKGHSALFAAALVAALVTPLIANAQAGKPTVTVVNTVANPVPVTGSLSVSGTAPVTVTNGASNPVNTQDAFRRTPVRLSSEDMNNFSYLVPNGSRFVVETISVLVGCSSLATSVGADLLISPVGGGVTPALDVALQHQGDQTFTATHSVRLVLEPGETLSAHFVCIPDASGEHAEIGVFGYLVSANSPSLAP